MTPVAVKATLLLVDDSPANLHSLIAGLRDQYQILLATDGEQALQVAKNSLPDLILLDVMMPGTDGYQVCRQLKQDPLTAEIPVIFVTGKTDERDEMVGFELGAVDYITKPFSLPLVLRRVQTHLELKYHRDQLRRQSREDGLTGLANRRCFDEFLQRSWQQALARRQSLALILSDVDYFKKYNDGYGHPAGDACLAAVAAAMAAVPLPAQALLARYGGEEFVLLAPLNLPAAAALAEALRVAVAALAIDHQYSPVSPQVTLSLGVAVCEVTSHGSAALLLQYADTALYQAKQQGRNCVCVYPG